MSQDERVRRIFARAERVLGPHEVGEAVAKVRAIIGPADIPESEQQAQKALNALRNGEAPTGEQLAALEIIVRLLRPVVYSRDGQLDDLPDDSGKNLYPPDYKDLWSDFRTKVAPLVSSIGRVEKKDGTHVGTGFLVDENILATNRHVLDVLTYGTEILGPNLARVVFKHEKGQINQPADIVDLESVAAIHPHLDMVLLKVAPQDRPALTLDPNALEEEAQIAVIGYPAEDRNNNPIFLDGVFGGVYGKRRAALGEVLDGSVSPALYHDCSTTQGNSGSPVLSLKTGRVAGIHRAGFFMYRNEAIDVVALQAFITSAT